MATRTQTKATGNGNKIQSWKGFKVLMDGNTNHAEILGYMWDAQQRTRS